jgi:uncharacterized membrane protein YtjA (UPF0391 family)
MSILKWALIFLVVSIIAGLLGFTGVSVVSADIARFLFYLFAAIFIVLLLLGRRYSGLSPPSTRRGLPQDQKTVLAKL